MGLPQAGEMGVSVMGPGETAYERRLRVVIGVRQLRCYNRGMGAVPENVSTSRTVVAIDGPVASGKSTVGRAAAERLGLRFLDTGIMYRAATWLALNSGGDVNDADAMGHLAKHCDMSLDENNRDSLISVNRRALARDDLASDEIDRNVSAVAASSTVRQALVAQQRSIASAGGIVMVGRDIGSVVLPDADVKLYIDAPVEVRAHRRLMQQADRGVDADHQQALEETIKRDRLDSERSDSPLTVPHDAIVIDTGRMDFPQTVAVVVSKIRAAIDTTVKPTMPRR